MNLIKVNKIKIDNCPCGMIHFISTYSKKDTKGRLDNMTGKWINSVRGEIIGRWVDCEKSYTRYKLINFL